VKISVGCDNQDTISVTPFDSYLLCAATGELSSSIIRVVVTVTKRALLSSSLPVAGSTAEENSNHTHVIFEEDSFTVQLTFSDGKCSSSIYLLAFHLCFVSKTLSFCLQIICIHVC